MMLYLWNRVITLCCYSVGKLLCGIELLPYVVIQLVNVLCGIGLLPYVIIQMVNYYVE